MIVATMSLQEKLAHVRADHERVLNKFDKKVKELRHELKASSKKHPRMHQEDYNSPRNIDWLVTVRITKKSEKVFMTAWWQLTGTGIEAFSLSPDTAFYFDSHFFQRYREHESDIVGAVDNMKQFLRRNYDITIKKLDTQRYGMQEAAGVAREGLFRGTVRPGNIVACDTFLPDPGLNKGQQAQKQEMDFHAETKDWSAAQMQQYGKWLEEKIRKLQDEGVLGTGTNEP